MLLRGILIDWILWFVFGTCIQLCRSFGLYSMEKTCAECLGNKCSTKYQVFNKVSLMKISPSCFWNFEELDDLWKQVFGFAASSIIVRYNSRLKRRFTDGSCFDADWSLITEYAHPKECHRVRSFPPYIMKCFHVEAN